MVYTSVEFFKQCGQQKRKVKNIFIGEKWNVKKCVWNVISELFCSYMHTDVLIMIWNIAIYTLTNRNQW